MTKKILITGKNSYVGNQLAEWLKKEPNKYEVIKRSVRDNKWKEIDFSRFDVVVHVAGIAHIKENKNNEKLYFEINRDLAFKVAKKAKKEHVNQFIFLSSMSVYGIDNGIITKDTSEKPKTNYGRSKLEGEKIIKALQSKDFNVAILRPPMIYGKDCKGNYSKLAKSIDYVPVFPKIKNQRSMLYIDNLTELIKLIIEDNSYGTFFPQNKEYVNTIKMIEAISSTHNKKFRLVKGLDFLLKIKNIKLINKVFGNLVYDKKMSLYDKEYCIVNFDTSIYLTEGRKING